MPGILLSLNGPFSSFGLAPTFVNLGLLGASCTQADRQPVSDRLMALSPCVRPLCHLFSDFGEVCSAAESLHSTLVGRVVNAPA